MRIPEQVREELKAPLGRLQSDFTGLKELGQSRRLVSVGDVCTLGLLAMGIRPHLAVFDHLFMRRRLEPGMIRILELHFKEPKKYKNTPGTLSERLLADAPRLLDEGGAVLIEGEEDLTALAFIMAAKEGDIIIYGQPEEGMVIVEPDEELKKKVAGWIKMAREP
ncbi:MAG: DUF359 domain-containing protein [Candidatus Micrarchaeota archaeon]